MDLGSIDYLGLDRVLRRGSGEILAERENALLLRDRISDARFLACEDPSLGLELLDRYVGPDCRLLMVSNADIGAAAFARYGFSERLDCYQVAYYGEKPACSDGLRVRTAEARDLPTLLAHYTRISPEELALVVSRGSLLLGYEEDRLIGFAGEHLEGSMGLLYVFPEYRRRGFGAALQRRMIARTMEAGFVPFGQVERHNLASLRLQQRLGMTLSERLISWMWK